MQEVAQADHTVILEVLQTLFSIIFPIATAVVTWVFVKRHYQKRELALKDELISAQRTDNESVAVEILGKKLGFYNKMLDDLEARCKAQSESLDTEIESLKKKVNKLREYNETLENKLREYESNL